ncbi:MAG: hypothetical protein AUI01_06780 [Ktedonobacter sp. 13_2_20CM_2_56_8]|nr:MAG: hypothetical protein AUI01_06780 [Ktedonobacter sp. 13_2_20CM_2_56_8]
MQDNDKADVGHSKCSGERTMDQCAVDRDINMPQTFSLSIRSRKRCETDSALPIRIVLMFHAADSMTGFLTLYFVDRQQRQSQGGVLILLKRPYKAAQL